MREVCIPHGTSRACELKDEIMERSRHQNNSKRVERKCVGNNAGAKGENPKNLTSVEDLTIMPLERRDIS